MTVSREVLISNRRGLHARASAKFVTLATQQPIAVQVAKGSATVTGTSIMGLMMLGAAKGDTVELIVAGENAARVADELAAMIEDGFGET